MEFLYLAGWAGLCLFVVPALLLDLRLLGMARRRVRVSAMVQHVLPWTSSGLAVMAAVRAVHLVAAPADLLRQPAFLTHLVLLGLLGVNVSLFHRGVFRQVETWDLGPVPLRARVTGLISIVLFTGIVATAWGVGTPNGLPH